MHPRERVLGLAKLIQQTKGGTYPPKLLAEANRLGVTLPPLHLPPISSNQSSDQKKLKGEQLDGRFKHKS
jgi:hypothetical protein